MADMMVAATDTSTEIDVRALASAVFRADVDLGVVA